MEDKKMNALAAVGLAIGGGFGMGGTFAPSDSLRSLAWGVDGLALVMASALLTLAFHRKGRDVVASGFLVFAFGESLIVSGAAMDLNASTPSFGAGVGLWAVALALISIPKAFPIIVRLLGLAASVLFAAVAIRIFALAEITPLSTPLPFYAYPVLVATMLGWIWTLLKRGVGSNPA